MTMASTLLDDPFSLPFEWSMLPRVLFGTYLIHRMGPKDLGALIDLRSHVLANLPVPDIYVREDNEAEFLLDHFGRNGETIGLYLPGENGSRQLVAYAMVGFPRADDPHNLGRTIGLPSNQLGKIGIIASCMVDPRWRGQGMQHELLRLRQILCVGHGRRLCMSMVSLHNDASRHNMMKIGLAIRWVGVLEDYGLRRQLLYFDQARPASFDTDHVEYVAKLDFDRQVELSQAGWWGISDSKVAANGEHLLGFCRPILPALDAVENQITATAQAD